MFRLQGLRHKKNTQHQCRCKLRKCWSSQGHVPGAAFTVLCSRETGSCYIAQSEVRVIKINTLAVLEGEHATRLYDVNYPTKTKQKKKQIPIKKSAEDTSQPAVETKRTVSILPLFCSRESPATPRHTLQQQEASHGIPGSPAPPAAAGGRTIRFIPASTLQKLNSGAEGRQKP